MNKRLNSRTAAEAATATLEPVADPNRDFEERAAISEYDGGLPREFAESLARF